KFTSMALLARVYLYLEEWENAEILSGRIIDNLENYKLLINIEEVFLANSLESIWQISPAGGGPLSSITNEARSFIISSPPPNSQVPVALSPDFLQIFNAKDYRLANWM